ncbi:kinase-like protein [Pilatotrama ljubarskyi]|nr:kinase-like protein [Pilatotrama ljubarskyi]
MAHRHGVFSHLLWMLWRCTPSSIRLAVYHYAARHGDASHGFRIRMLPYGLVLKTVSGSPHIEADNIRFVAENTSVPVPRILDVLDDPPELDGGFILMTRVEGVSLGQWISDHAIRAPGHLELLQRMDVCIAKGDDAGFNVTIEKLKLMPPTTLDMSDAAPLVQDLRDAFVELRSLPSPSSAVTGLRGRPLKCSRGGDITLIGPFRDQQEFKDFIFAQANSSIFAHRMPTLHCLAEPVNARKHRICFTHADLAPRNIVVKDGRLAGIIDWEFAGWYPEYWERTSMEAQMMHEPVTHQFWDAVQLFAPERYDEEMTLEWMLWACTGTTAVMSEAGDSPYCPRVRDSPYPVPKS